MRDLIRAMGSRGRDRAGCAVAGPHHLPPGFARDAPGDEPLTEPEWREPGAVAPPFRHLDDVEIRGGDRFDHFKARDELADFGAAQR